MDTKIFFNLKKKNLKKKEAFPHLAVEISGYILLHSGSFFIIVIKHTCTQQEIHLKWIPEFTPEIAKNRGKLGYKR